MPQPTPETLLNMSLDRTAGGRNNGGYWLAQQLHANGYTEDDARAVMCRFVSATRGNGPNPYTEREALGTLKAEYRRTAKQPWTSPGTSSPGEWKARRLRQAFPTAPPARTVNEPDPKSVAGFVRQRGKCEPIEGTPAAEYLTGRGIPADLFRAARCAYSPGWGQVGAAVVFPIRDEQGKTIAANGRAITPRPEGSKTKQTFGPMAGGVFCTPGALDADPVAVTEAPIDALTLHLAGLPCIATCGTSNLAPWVKDRLARSVRPGYSRTVYVAHDNDAPGEAAAARIGANLPLVRTVRLRPIRKDWNADLTAGGLDALREWLESEGGYADATQKGAEQSDNSPTAGEPIDADSCEQPPADWPPGLEPLAESHSSAVFSAVNAAMDRVDRYAEQVDLAAWIMEALADRPLPIRICPGVTISDPARYALAEAQTLLSGSPVLSRTARERLDQLGILPSPGGTTGEQPAGNLMEEPSVS